MSKKLQHESTRTILPIVGDSIASICISAQRFPEIVFEDDSGQTSSLELGDQFTIGRGNSTQTISGFSTRPDIDFCAMSPLLELIGSKVTGATAHKNGRLELAFSNAMTLETTSTTGYEAWHFQFPRAGRPCGSDTSALISIDGAADHLVISDS